MSSTISAIGNVSNDFAGVRIQDFETWRLAPRNENTMIRLVENERCVSVEFAQRPSRSHRPFLPVDDPDETFVSDIGKHPGAIFLNSHCFDIGGVHFNVAYLLTSARIDDTDQCIGQFASEPPAEI